MIILGLTGSIGMGKTTIGKMMEYLGCAVHDSDASVKSALNPYGKGFEAVALSFPEVWDKKKHLIKKDILSDLVFNDGAARKKLENILHPIVKRDQRDFLNKQKALGCEICVLDIPLLFETGAQERVDYTVVVDAPFFIQSQRVLRRNGMTEDKFFKILSSQMPNHQKRVLADFVIQTGLGKAYSMKQVKRVLREIT